MLLNRFRISIVMAGFAFAWSLVSLLTFLAHNYSSMMVCRFILGIVEAPVGLRLCSFFGLGNTVNICY
jgi:MFS family permease